MGVHIQTYRCRIGSFCIKNSSRSSYGWTGCKHDEGNSSNCKPLLMLPFLLVTFQIAMFKLSSGLTNTLPKDVADEHIKELFSNMQTTQRLLVQVYVTQNVVKSLNETAFASESSNVLLLRVIRKHLAISGVEPNPGPRSSSSEENEQQTNNATDSTQPNSGDDYNVDAHADQSRGNTVIHCSARYEDYRTLRSRVNTFRNWPSNLHQMPEEMAEAGWCYKGESDVCFCYSCGKRLMDWQPEDNPWIEHCKFSKHCPHLREIKGYAFINHVRQRTDNPAAITATNQVPCYDTTVEGPTTHTRSVEESQSMQPENEPNIQLTHNIPPSFDAQETNLIQQLTNHTDIVRALHEDENETDVLLDANVQDVLEDPNLQQDPNSRVRVSNGNWSVFTCHLCQINLSNALFLPCRHLMYCIDCTRHCDWCPNCNTPIVERIETYMA
ncbi:E3 ubiquitin-protein ligase XIAP-like [Dreissena polymorpha]|uniref:E3 ubiquitin-protein ligase XIAP-like n=1 Tax=Dreissena polymorpha TaxID=45954 RepID=UPI0022656D82|nr:E3 ubiquitin-protein ligase XIAP-like [Dreissena polymorpha]